MSVTDLIQNLLETFKRDTETLLTRDKSPENDDICTEYEKIFIDNIEENNTPLSVKLYAYYKYRELLLRTTSINIATFNCNKIQDIVNTNRLLLKKNTNYTIPSLTLTETLVPVNKSNLNNYKHWIVRTRPDLYKIEGPLVSNKQMNDIGDTYKGSEKGDEEGDEEKGDEEKGDEEKGDEEKGDEEKGDEEGSDEEKGDEEKGDEEGSDEEGSDEEGSDEEGSDEEGDEEGEEEGDEEGDEEEGDEEGDEEKGSEESDFDCEEILDSSHISFENYDIFILNKLYNSDIPENLAVRVKNRLSDKKVDLVYTDVETGYKKEYNKDFIDEQAYNSIYKSIKQNFFVADATEQKIFKDMVKNTIGSKPRTEKYKEYYIRFFKHIEYYEWFQVEQDEKEGKEENNILTHIVGSDYNDIYRYLYDLKNEGKYKFIYKFNHGKFLQKRGIELLFIKMFNYDYGHRSDRNIAREPYFWAYNLVLYLKEKLNN